MMAKSSSGRRCQHLVIYVLYLCTYARGYRSTECSFQIHILPDILIRPVYLPLMFSMDAFSILTPKSTLEGAATERGEMVMEVAIGIVAF